MTFQTGSKIYEGDISDASFVFAAESLGAIGPDAKDAVPILLQGVSSTNVGKRYVAMRALGMIHSKPELVVPVLMKQLSDHAGMVSSAHFITVVQALRNFGTNAKPAVPALIKAMDDPRPGMRATVISALKQSDPEVVVNLHTNSASINPQTPP
jgi:HEAT repeat protein